MCHAPLTLRHTHPFLVLFACWGWPEDVSAEVAGGLPSPPLPYPVPLALLRYADWLVGLTVASIIALLVFFAFG